MKRSCLLLLILLATNTSAVPRSLQEKVIYKHKTSSHQVSDYPGGYLAPYVLVGGPHENFKEFVCFWVTYRQEVDEQ